MPRRHKKKTPLLEAVTLNVLAAVWFSRMIWRLTHGRAPWQGRPAR